MRKLILYSVIFIQIAIIISLVRGIQLSKRSAGRIALMEETRDKLKVESEKLKQESQYVGSEYYLEKVARDELHLAKPGETVVIIPDSGFETPDVSKKIEEKVEQPNWMKWWDVLSGKI